MLRNYIFLRNDLQTEIFFLHSVFKVFITEKKNTTKILIIDSIEYIKACLMASKTVRILSLNHLIL
jgi:hypothetical protein